MFDFIFGLFAVTGAVVDSASYRLPPPSHDTPRQFYLDEIVTYHELISIDKDAFRQGDLVFQAHGIQFNVSTREHSEVFHPNVTFTRHHEDGTKSLIDIDTSRFRVGSVADFTDSYAHFTFYQDGSTDGVIVIADEKYHLEPLHRFNSSNIKPATKNHVIYKASHVKPEIFESLEPICGASIHRNLLEKQNRFNANSNRKPFAPPYESSINNNKNNNNNYRERRAVEDCRDIVGTKCTCPMILVGDAKFFGGPNGKSSAELSTQFMVNALITVDAIYRRTEFNGLTGIGLSVIAAEVYSSSTTPNNPVPDEVYTAEAFLETFGSNLKSHSKFGSACLAHLFTHRDFANGVLGLAWVGGPSSSGGICDTNIKTGWSTSLNYGRDMPSSVFHITMAHEVGHNFGSPHDSDASCTPGGSAGNYIMYPSATDGALANNNEFSPCSRSSMGANLDVRRDQCFSVAAAYCGNGWVEGDEECDSNTTCCDQATCKAAAGVQCSPQDKVGSVCCQESCFFASVDDNITCRADTECSEGAVCNGTSASCPQVVPKADGTFCASKSKLCSNGVCDASICERYGATQCSPVDNECRIGCNGSGWGDGVSCVSTFDPDTPAAYKVDFGDQGIQLQAGFPCDNYNGYCDDNFVCQSVDSEDLLRDLEDKLKNLADFDKIWEWISSNWARSGGILGGVVVLSLALFLTRRKFKKPKEYDALIDSEDHDDPDYGSSSIASQSSADNRKKRRTIFKNANAKFHG